LASWLTCSGTIYPHSGHPSVAQDKRRTGSVPPLEVNCWRLYATRCMVNFYHNITHPVERSQYVCCQRTSAKWGASHCKLRMS